MIVLIIKNPLVLNFFSKNISKIFEIQVLKRNASYIIEVKVSINYFIKKRYIIDLIYDGVCPTCGEFNTRDHLPAFEFNHLYIILYELGLITLEERDEAKENKEPSSDIMRKYLF